jgi:hypothetical protein
MTTLKQLIDSKVLHHGREDIVLIEVSKIEAAIKEWLASKDQEFVNNPEYFHVTNFEIACKKDFINELLKELSE